MRPVQFFTDEYLEQCRKMSPLEIVRFLEGFRQLQGATAGKSKLISMKVPDALLATFKQHCELNGVRYQTKIKELMMRHLRDTP
ncbi:MAG: hypothetical protein HUU37_10465 [Bdellovibrionales bacterium]|nr:hypothetical protein [Bdellovibrionales bacterium]